MPSSADMLRSLTTVNDTIFNNLMGQIPEDLSPVEKKKMLQTLVTGLNKTEELADLAGNRAEETMKDMKDVMLSKNYFNIIKTAQNIENELANIPDTSMPNISENNNISENDINNISFNEKLDIFSDASSVRDKMNSFSSVDEALSYFMPLVSDDKIIKEDGLSPNPINPKQIVSDTVKTYFENIDSMNDQDQIEIASVIFDVLPASVKGDNGQMIAKQKIASEAVASSNKELLSLASSLCNRNERNVFNLSKTAQHKNLTNNVMLSGPSNTRIDTLTGNLVSDLHIIERNKGFGLKIDNLLDIDYEALWRQNIMDKYSRPYRDKDGNWVGGYLNKRFEINQNIPAGSNYQLKPGQKRKPILPQYGNIGSRLEHARDNDLLNPLSKTASSTFNLKKKTAQLKPIKDLQDPFSSEEERRKNKVSTSKTCPACKSTNSSTNAKCSNCGMPLSEVDVTYHNHTVSPKKHNSNSNPNVFSVYPGQRVANISNNIKNIYKKPLSNTELLISDPEAENIDNDHLSDVQHSADHLGM